MKFNWFYILVLVLVGALLFITRSLYNGSTQSWVGVAEAKDFNITSEKQATIKSVPIIQGQAIKKGDTLIQLYSIKLIQEADKLKSKISTLQSERDEKRKLANSEIQLIQSSNDIDINKLEKEVNQIESELQLNKKISSDLNLNQSTSNESPIEEKLNSLKQEIKLRTKATQIKINDIQVKSKSDQLVIQNQIELLTNDLELINNEQKSLTKISLTDGVVESVPVKPGDEVDAYTKLVSVFPTHPTSAIGYLRAKATPPAIGTKVKIQSYDARWKQSEGKIIGYGAVTSLPDILQKATAVKAFGKEIFIELPVQNDFATGEKLLINVWEE